jgi:alanine racemase
MPIADARAWIELDLHALRANFDTIRRTVGAGVAIIPMVKADAYGLGAPVVVRTLQPLGPWGFGVATAYEGAELRSLGVVSPVLVVAPLPPRAVDLAARSRLIATISSLDGLDAWIAAAQRLGGDALDFHVEVDTGMGRSGFDWRDAGQWASAIAARLEPCVRWTGVFTHFHSADSPNARHTEAQWERFRSTLVQLPVQAEDLLVHASNSAATLRWPGYWADAVRPGIFLYGGEPAPLVRGLPAPRPVVAVRSRLALVREKPAGSTAGYGATYIARDAEVWGTVTVGYGDGLPRALGNRCGVLVRGRRVPVIGRISMDLMTVSLKKVPDAEVGDVVTLIGEDGGERITVDEVAGLIGTIGYEMLTGLGSRLPRVERAAETEGGEHRCVG